uniref:Uncharacterized protein n=1 Tax=Timema poppense TaxID=170557 RepID=A0A7R9D6X0_TIMPO|nr:unnamed protein product [Timema poppensis]
MNNITTFHCNVQTHTQTRSVIRVSLYIQLYGFPRTKHLEIFCDSCGGLYKNVSTFGFFHLLVYYEKRLDYVKKVFPIRGHSYVECDNNVDLIDQGEEAELPEDWYQVFQDAQQLSSPFEIINVEEQSEIIKGWSAHLDHIYKKKLPFHSRPGRELEITREHAALVRFRTSYNGFYEQASLVPPRKKRTTLLTEHDLREGEITLPSVHYEGFLKISSEKYKDLQNLKRFFCSETQTYFDHLPQ